MRGFLGDSDELDRRTRIVAREHGALGLLEVQLGNMHNRFWTCGDVKSARAMLLELRDTVRARGRELNTSSPVCMDDVDLLQIGG